MNVHALAWAYFGFTVGGIIAAALVFYAIGRTIDLIVAKLNPKQKEDAALVAGFVLICLFLLAVCYTVAYEVAA